MQQDKAREMARDGMKPIEIAAVFGIGVHLVPFETIKGMALSLGSHKLILINDGLTEMEQQLVCGHELGHFSLHGEHNFMFILENTLLYPKQEYQANLYGCKLLLGEKGECYETEVKAAASCRSLREMAGIIAALERGEG